MISTTPAINGEILDTPPANDYDAERLLVGSLIINPDRIDTLDLHAGHFFNEQTRTTFAELKRMRANGELIDSAHVLRRLQEFGDVFPGGHVAAFIGTLTDGASALATRFPDYVKQLTDAYNRREVEGVGLSIVKAARSRLPTHELLSQARIAFETLDEGQSRRVLEYRTLTAAELITTETETEYYCGSILAAGQPAIIGAPPKCCKTLYTTDLAISLATGTPHLGLHDVPRPLRVAFMSGESGQAASRVCFRSVAESKGLDPSDLGNLVWSDDVPRFQSPDHRAAIRAYLRQHTPEVLIIDPAYRALGDAKHESVFEMGGLLGDINDLCKAEGTTLVIVHHTRKKQPGQEYTPTTLDDLAFAGFREFFRQWILISRRRPYETASGLHELRVDAGGSARHSWCGAVTIDEGPFDAPRWYVTCQGISEAKETADAAKEREADKKKEATRERNREKLVKAAAKNPAGETISFLAAVAGLGVTAYRAALSDALDLGELVPCAIQKNNKSYEAFRLPNDPT